MNTLISTYNYNCITDSNYTYLFYFIFISYQFINRLLLVCYVYILQHVSEFSPHFQTKLMFQTLQVSVEDGVRDPKRVTE